VSISEIMEQSTLSNAAYKNLWQGNVTPLLLSLDGLTDYKQPTRPRTRLVKMRPNVA
jgi:hypothetical protein